MYNRKIQDGWFSYLGYLYGPQTLIKHQISIRHDWWECVHQSITWGRNRFSSSYHTYKMTPHGSQYKNTQNWIDIQRMNYYCIKKCLDLVRPLSTSLEVVMRISQTRCLTKYLHLMCQVSLKPSTLCISNLYNFLTSKRTYYKNDASYSSGQPSIHTVK